MIYARGICAPLAYLTSRPWGLYTTGQRAGADTSGSSLFIGTRGAQVSDLRSFFCEPMRYLTQQEVADRLKLKVRTVESWRRTLRGPPWFRVGPRLVRYSEAALEAWVQGCDPYSVETLDGEDEFP